MIDLVRQFAEYHSKEFIALGEKFSKYRSILINKPTYNDEEAKLWFKFMGECYKDWMFALYSVQVVVDSLMTEQPSGRYLIYPVTQNCLGENNFIAFAYVDKPYQGLDWQLQEIGLDTIGWAVLVKDVKSGQVFKYPIHNFSSSALCTLIAQLRTIEPTKLDIRRDI